MIKPYGPKSILKHPNAHPVQYKRIVFSISLKTSSSDSSSDRLPLQQTWKWTQPLFVKETSSSQCHPKRNPPARTRVPSARTRRAGAASRTPPGTVALSDVGTVLGETMFLGMRSVSQAGRSVWFEGRMERLETVHGAVPSLQSFQSRWHRPQDVLYMEVHINHLLGSVPSTLNPLYLYNINK